MSRLDENLGAVNYDNLINSMNPPAEPFTVTIRKESTEAATYKRGTLLALSGGKDGDGKMVIFGTAAASGDGKVETLTANCVLAEDVEVDTEEDAVALAYRTGHFNTNALITKNSTKITAADKEALRTVGILLSDAVGN